VKHENPLYFYPFAFFVGLGILGKYAMITIYISLLIFFLTSKKRRVLLNRSHFYLSFIVLLVVSSPLFIWTFKNDFVNFMHVLHQGKNQSAKSFISIKYFFEFISGQAGVVTPLLFGMMIWAQIKAFKLPQDHKWKEHFELLTWFGLPTFITYFVMSFKVRIHPNWAAACYPALLMLTAGISWDRYQSMTDVGMRKFRKLLYFTFGFAVLVMVLAYNTDTIRLFGGKVLPERVSETSFLSKPVNKALAFFHNPKKDPTNRLKGWRELGKHVDKVMSNFDEDNIFIFSSQYQVAGEIAFYTKKKFKTYCINLGRRLNQYDIWGGWEDLIGKDAIQIEDTKTTVHEKVSRSFESCELLEYFQAKRVGKVIKEWTIFKCRNFKGLEEEDGIMSY
jgi:undecaprenyl-diphosphatase